MTLGEAGVLCAIAAHWKVMGHGIGLAGVARMSKHNFPRDAVRALVRRGFLEIDWRGKNMAYATARPTPKAWSELGVSP